ncbi:unnamed protein product [Acanthoscelides obtectus]|uniref:Uncharacterized protein n=1 Tax=Acanthoscelides obtectus TaxID=200917 RepID=A0A9P0PEC8_ACAOB|nr:unnamed protein product [Acanthoscelides obtectus]CAK1671627.1 hypothetical protein AOBTE_LOCUS28369 [Acanthoscelides obtectus]
MPTDNDPPDGGSTDMDISSIGGGSNNGVDSRQGLILNTSISTDTTPDKCTVFNLQKPKQYSDFIYVFVEKINTENIGTLHPMAIGHIFHKKLNIPNIVNIEKVGQMPNTEFPPLPPKEPSHSRSANPSRSQSTNSFHTVTQRIARPLSQQEKPNKKRKVVSPINDSHIPPMFPFSFGPSNPLPLRETDTTEIPDDRFLEALFKTLQLILSKVKSFEELANIDITYVKNIYKDSYPPNEEPSDQDEY